MIPKLLVAALCLALLCSCTSLSMNTEDLLTPPSLNQRQAQVEEALEATISPNSILYRYPQRGDYRSPFVFYDLDKNGRQEAMVFYSYRSDPQYVRAKILRETGDGSWEQVKDLSGFGDQVDFIQFARLTDSEAECILIGWQDARQGQSVLSIYTYDGAAFQSEIEISYQTNGLSVDDYFDNGLNEVLLVRQDRDGEYFLCLIGTTPDGRLGILAELSLSLEINTVLQMRKGRLWNGNYAVYIDERHIDTYLATEVVEVTPTHPYLLSRVGDVDYELFSQTFRDGEALSTDLRGDGMVEIPTLEELLWVSPESELEPPPLTHYIQLNSMGTFHTAYSAAVNADAGYLLFFPKRWQDRVTVQGSPETNEWRFYKVDPVTLQPVVELLRIRVHFTRDNIDRFVQQNYILMAEKGMFQYYAYLPNLPGEFLALNETELSQLFMLL